MATSTLDPDNIPERDRQLGKGHGTDSLGPSDISDTGSDMQGAQRWAQETDIGLDKGTHEDPDIGNAGIDSDTDAMGTGERGTAGRDSGIELGADINVDRIDDLSVGEDINEDDMTGMQPPRSRRPGRPRQQR